MTMARNRCVTMRNHCDIRRSFGAVLAVAALSWCVGCGVNEARFGALGVSAAAPRATLSGRTSAQASPALELSPGCPGFVDPSTPEHLVRVTDGGPFVLSVSSAMGPLALAVSGQGEVRCDSDGGTGHTPHVGLEQPGEYLVYVGALQAAQELPYELVVTPATEATGRAGTPVAQDTRVSVTITSQPAGATVRTPEGEVLGTTPAMFVLPVPGDQVGQERRFILEMSGHRTTEVTGRLLGGSMALHASLLSATDTPPTTPLDTPPQNPTNPVTLGELAIATNEPSVAIRDYTTVEQHLEVPTDCTIGRAALVLDLQHSYVGDLRVSLRAPSGTEVVVHNHQGGSRRALSTTIDWDDRRGVLHTLAGQNARGRWTLAVRDSVGADTGTLQSFAVRLTCAAPGTVTPPATVTRQRPRPRSTPPPSAPVNGVISPWRTPPVLQQPHRSNPRSDGIISPF